jgi:hypothetical protein
MGWSVDTQQLKIERIFRKVKRKCKVTHPESPDPTILIQYEGKRVGVDVMQSVVELFPDFVYVHFVPDTIFPEESKVGATLEPAGSNQTTAQ